MKPMIEPQQRRLAGAVAADDRDGVALLEGRRDAVQHRDAGDLRRDGLERQHRHSPITLRITTGSREHLVGRAVGGDPAGDPGAQPGGIAPRRCRCRARRRWWSRGARRARPSAPASSSCFSSEDTPLVGSSMIISLGRSTSAIATSSSLRCPPGSDPARSSGAGRELQQFQRLVHCRAASTASSSGNQKPRRRLTDEAASSRHSRTVCSVKICGNWKIRPTPRRVIARELWPVMSWPSKKTVPAVGLEVAGADVDEGGLAGAVLADHRQSLALRQLEVDRLGGDHAAECQRDAAGLAGVPPSRRLLATPCAAVRPACAPAAEPARQQSVDAAWARRTPSTIRTSRAPAATCR